MAKKPLTQSLLRDILALADDVETGLEGADEVKCDDFDERVDQVKRVQRFARSRLSAEKKEEANAQG